MSEGVLPGEIFGCASSPRGLLLWIVRVWLLRLLQELILGKALAINPSLSLSLSLSKTNFGA
jgi:hypothetical protein